MIGIVALALVFALATACREALSFFFLLGIPMAGLTILLDPLAF
jgi:hypothetical protein